MKASYLPNTKILTLQAESHLDIFNLGKIAGRLKVESWEPTNESEAEVRIGLDELVGALVQ